ncbi:MAG: diadenylate cyclase CdaA [Acidaminococcales bacterium]|jgi:diadenylate cyclase|nr:diadenylate cyclase CdaA [Acidaminococcales bacterium]
MIAQLQSLFLSLRLWDLFDIFIISVVFYYLYMLLKDTRAISLVKGLTFLLVLTFLSGWFELHVVYWLLQKCMTVLLVALPVVFQPELRRALEHIGRGNFFAKNFFDEATVENLLAALSSAVLNMAKHRIGALIVVERSIGLNDYIETGVRIDAVVSSELLINIFIPNTPLHDGAVILRGGRIAAAAALLPLTEAHGLSQELGTRHRAAIGLSEQTDALVLAVSEETGTISLASGGYLRRELTGEDIRKTLRPVLLADSQNIDLKSSLNALFKNWRLP